MAKTSRNSAEAQFAQLKRDSQMLKERELAERARDAKVARLQALRLAKEEADQKEALARKAETAAQPSKRGKKAANT